MKTTGNIHFSDDLLAAYLDGNASAEECRQILQSLGNDELREILNISQLVDIDLNIDHSGDVELLPLAAMAATSITSCGCSAECEKYILGRRAIEFSEERIAEQGARNNWQSKDGTALHNIGRHLESFGLAVVRRFKCSIDDIARALSENRDVIAVVDGGEIVSVDALVDEEQADAAIYQCAEEYVEDVFIGEIPDHCVVVKACDLEAQTVTLYDPNQEDKEVVCPISHFTDAWQDSKRYLVIACDAADYEYQPQPIDLSDVTLDDSLNELREAIAENAHEVWAFNRRNEGWSYGPQRSDTLKQTPDMVPYSMLPDSEKHYDREMAMQTIKLMRKLGYDIVRSDNTHRPLRCNNCGVNITQEHLFCHKCGEKIER